MCPFQHLNSSKDASSPLMHDCNTPEPDVFDEKLKTREALKIDNLIFRII